jgi:hypothetical protein
MDGVGAALRRGQEWLLRHYQPFTTRDDRFWLSKEIYSMPRVDRVFELSAMLAGALEDHHGTTLDGG